MRQCPDCHFAFVANPWTEYEEIYSESYYQGSGADPLADYSFDLASPAKTAHIYEWRGVFQAVRSLVTLDQSTQWLDFGCGTGGLVRYARDQNIPALGFEEGAIARSARSMGVPILDARQLEAHKESFDVVTAIEVLEHVPQPIPVLQQIRELLKPGGLFFYTTGNARPYRDRLIQWSYVTPEVHISFYEPETMARALRSAGFRPESRGYLPGFTDILRYKILKNLRVKRRSTWEALVPWPLVSRCAQAHFKTLAHPIGWAGVGS